MNQLINEWNAMIEQLSGFEKSETESREAFELKITKVIYEFMCSWKEQTDDLEQLTEKIVNEAIQAGRITITEVYDPVTESLNMVVGGEV